MNVSRIESAPHHYVRGDSENEPIVVRNPNAPPSEDIDAGDVLYLTLLIAD